MFDFADMTENGILHCCPLAVIIQGIHSRGFYLQEVPTMVI